MKRGPPGKIKSIRQNKSKDSQGVARRVCGENTTLTPHSSKGSIVGFENRDLEAAPNRCGISERLGSIAGSRPVTNT